jgi:hypothetical protein
MYRRFLRPSQRQRVFRSRGLKSFRPFRSPHRTGLADGRYRVLLSRHVDGHIAVVGASTKEVEVLLRAALFEPRRTSWSCSDPATSSGTVVEYRRERRCRQAGRELSNKELCDKAGPYAVLKRNELESEKRHPGELARRRAAGNELLDYAKEIGARMQAMQGFLSHSDLRT